MPGISAKTEQTTVRLPVDVLEWIKTQDGSKADVIVRAIRSLKAGGKLADALEAMPVTVDPRIAELEAERDQWRDRAQAIVSAGKEPRGGVMLGRGADPMHRGSGQVLATVVPSGLSGAVTPRFRRGSEGEKATRS